MRVEIRSFASEPVAGIAAQNPLCPGGIYAVASPLPRHPGYSRNSDWAGDSPGEGRIPRGSGFLLARFDGVAGVIDRHQLESISQQVTGRPGAFGSATLPAAAPQA